MNNSDDNMINRLPTDAEIESRSRAVFRNACENTDSYHALRLGLARRKAVNGRAGRSGVRLWAPLAGGAVACCALAVGVVLMRPINPSTASNAAHVAPIPASQVDDADELPEVGSSQMEIMQNLDFYRWLAAQSAAAAATPGARR